MAAVGELQTRAIEALRAGRYADAESCYRELLSVQSHPALLNNLGLVLAAQRRHAEAVEFFERSILARPADINARIGLANALVFCDRPGEALARCDEILAIDPANGDARHNRAVALRALNRHREAIAELRALLAQDAGDADAEFNLALSELALGDFVSGWRHYEARWRGPRANPPLPLPHLRAWSPGERLEGRRVLVQAEQGLGDALCFLRWVPRVASVCGHLEVQVPRPLAALVARNLPGHEVSVLGESPRTAVDLRLPLMSLPLALGLDERTLFEERAYIQAGKRVLEWRERWPPARRRAFAWRGSPTFRHDHQRSIPIEGWAPWLEATRAAAIEVVAVQKDITVHERRWLERYPHVTIPEPDFEETSAILALVERLVCVDTSVAHLAGAMDRPVMLLLCFAPDFLWGPAGERTPFYPSHRLLRQRKPGEWAPVIESLAKDP